MVVPMCIMLVPLQFLSKAVKSLRMARMVLKNTYVFAYYLRKNNQVSEVPQLCPRRSAAVGGLAHCAARACVCLRWAVCHF